MLKAKWEEIKGKKYKKSWNQWQSTKMSVP